MKTTIKVMTLNDGSTFEYDTIISAYAFFSNHRYVDSAANNGNLLEMQFTGIRLKEDPPGIMIADCDNAYLVDFNEPIYVRLIPFDAIVSELRIKYTKLLKFDYKGDTR